MCALTSQQPACLRQQPHSTHSARPLAGGSLGTRAPTGSTPCSLGPRSKTQFPGLMPRGPPAPGPGSARAPMQPTPDIRRRPRMKRGKTPSSSPGTLRNYWCSPTVHLCPTSRPCFPRGPAVPGTPLTPAAWKSQCCPVWGFIHSGVYTKHAWRNA